MLLDPGRAQELHLGHELPIHRFGLRSRPGFLPSPERDVLPAIVLPLHTAAGRRVPFEVLAGLGARPARLVRPETASAAPEREDIAFFAHLTEAQADALRHEHDLAPGLLILADGEVRTLGGPPGPPTWLVALPRIVLGRNEWIADNTDADLSMGALLADLVAASYTRSLPHVRLATGYLYRRGMVRLLGLLSDPHVHLKLLFSGRTDRDTALALTQPLAPAASEPSSSEAATRALSATLIDEIEATEDASFADVCRRALEANRLEVRVYTRAFLHAKLFLAYEDHPRTGLKGDAVIGSSNISQAGFDHGGNLELDIAVSDPRTLLPLRTWFDARWDEGLPPEPPLLEVVDTWRPTPPPTFETPGLLEVWRAGRQQRLAPPDRYLALLAHLYEDQLDFVDTLPIEPYPAHPERTLEPSPEQLEGVQDLQYRLRTARIGFLADSVGLGKTVTALGTAWFLARAGLIDRFAVVAPRKLFHQWRADAQALGMPTDAFDTLNRHALERERPERAAESLARYRLVLVDEAHETLRSRGNKLWKALRAWLAADPSTMVLLISATPWNNSREDIYSYLALAWADHPALLEAHFPALSRRPIGPLMKMFEAATHPRAFLDLGQGDYDALFGHVFVQRTRHGLKKMGDLGFPERIPHPEETRASPPHEAYFQRLRRDLDALHIPYREPFAALRRALAAVGAEGVEAPGLSNLQGAFVLQLYKRAESSMYALAVSLAGVRRRLAAFRAELTAVHHVPDPVAWLRLWLNEIYLRQAPLDAVIDGEEDDTDGLLTEPGPAEEARRANLESLLARLDASTVIRAADWLLTNEVGPDEKVINGLVDHLGPELDASDPKLQLLLQPVLVHHVARHKPVLVAAYADTALRVFLRLITQIPNARIGLALGGGEGWVYHPQSRHVPTDLTPEAWHTTLALPGPERRRQLLEGDKRARRVDRGDLLAAFAPRAQRRPDAIHAVGGEVDILVGSEAISVGQNLQDSTALIHLDLPWNPMVLEQRIGRVDRRGGGRLEGNRRVVDIYYCWSAAAVEGEVELRRRLMEKVRGALRDTRFDEPLLAEVWQELQKAHDDHARKAALARVLSEGQATQVEAVTRVEGTDAYSGREVDGLRRLAQVPRAEGEPPRPVVAAGLRGPAPARWLLTLELTPLGEDGRSRRDPFLCHLALPESPSPDLGLRSDLATVVAALTDATGPAPGPDVEVRTWTQHLHTLDTALQAAARRTLAAHNEQIRQTLQQKPRPTASERLDQQMGAAHRALSREVDKPGPVRERVKTDERRQTLMRLLKARQSWRLVGPDGEQLALDWLAHITTNPRRFLETDTDFDRAWDTLFGQVAEDTPDQLALPAPETTWKTLQVKVLAAAWCGTQGHSR